MINLSELWMAIEGRVLKLIHKTEAIGCRVINTSTQTIPNATMTALTFNTVIYDTDSCWSAGAPTRLYAQRDGYYLAGGGWSLADTQNTAASRIVTAVLVNGTNQIQGSETHSKANTSINVSVATGMFWLSAGQYIEIAAYHDEGASKTAGAATSINEGLCCGWLMRVG